MSLRSRALTVLTVVVLLAAAACGQKSGVAGTAVQAGGGGGTADTSGGGGTATTTGGGGGGGGQHEPGSDDKDGITNDEIVIGVHAPVTGAAPIPQTTFDVGKDIYWKFLAQSDPSALGGRKVRVVFRDDQFNPRTAVQVCREMVEKEHAFVLIGAAGADQITACAKYADQVGVPYFSAGVNESGLTDLSTYYAFSQTYAQQAPEVAQQIKDAGFEKVGVVIEDTPSFQDAHTAFIKAAKKAGLDVVTDDSIGKTASEAEALAEVQKLKDAKADAVFILTSPLVYLSVASGARNQNFEPQFFGPGITNGINQVAEFGCPNVANGNFLSPYPELDVINELDPDYLTAYDEFGQGKQGDDIGLALWGLNKNLKLMFDAAGDNLGRAALMNAIESGDEFSSNVFPPVKYAPDNHFGGTDAYLLKADCDAKDYKTAKRSVATAEGE